MGVSRAYLVCEVTRHCILAMSEPVNMMWGSEVGLILPQQATQARGLVIGVQCEEGGVPGPGQVAGGQVYEGIADGQPDGAAVDDQGWLCPGHHYSNIWE